MPLGTNIEVCSRGFPLYYNRCTLKFKDALWAGLTDQHIKMPMGVTAENLGAKYEITRQETDEFAARSQKRWHLGACELVFA